MKCDDDTFINVPNLIHALLGGTIPVYSGFNVKSPENRLVDSKYLLLGYKHCNRRPISEVANKW